MLASRPGASVLRIARDPMDGLSGALAERVVALLDGSGVRAALVGRSEAHDVELRAIAPIGATAALGAASFFAVAGAVAGDEAGAGAIMRDPRAAEQRVGEVWARATAAVLGRVSAGIFVREGVMDAGFDAYGRLSLGDAWVQRGAGR